MPFASLAPEQLEQWFDKIYIDAPGAKLRVEDKRKLAELQGMVREVAMAIQRTSRRKPCIRMVDAAAGKAYVGLIVADLLMPIVHRPFDLTIIERNGRFAAICEAIAAIPRPLGTVSVRMGDVQHASLWPDQPDVVFALHACGEASDHIIDMVAAKQSRHLLLVPCCVASHLPSSMRASRRAEELGVGRHGQVRRRWVEAHVLTERVLRLESLGYHTTVAEFVPPTITPYNLVLRAQRVGEPARMLEAKRNLEQMQRQ